MAEYFGFCVGADLNLSELGSLFCSEVLVSSAVTWSFSAPANRMRGRCNHYSQRNLSYRSISLHIHTSSYETENYNHS